MQNLILLDGQKFQITIQRLCHQLIENHNDFSNSVIIGIQPRGILLSERIAKELQKILPGLRILNGSLDITFFRDDFRRREDPLVPNSTRIDFIIEGKKVILIDDVLWTGRTIRAAIDAKNQLGKVLNLSNNSGNSVYPYLRISDNNIHVVWVDNTSDSSVLFSTIDLSGSTVTKKLVKSDQTDVYTNPMIFDTEDKLWISWTESNKDVNKVVIVDQEKP